MMQTMVTLIVMALTLAQADPARDALRLGRTGDQALYDAFNAGYRLAESGPVSSAEVITEFRRAVLIVRDHANADDVVRAREAGQFRVSHRHADL